MISQIGGKKRRGAIGLISAILLSTIAAITSTGVILNAGYLDALLSGTAKASSILRGVDYTSGESKPLRTEERDLWIAFIKHNTVALKDIVIFKEGVRKMYRSTQDYMKFLDSMYRKGSVKNSYGWRPYYKDYLLRFDSVNNMAVIFPQFEEIPENIYKHTTGSRADRLNIFILDTQENRDLYGTGKVVREKELEEIFSDSAKTKLN